MWYEPRNTYQHARTIGIAGQHIEPPLFIIRELLVFLSLGMIILVPAGGKKKKKSAATDRLLEVGKCEPHGVRNLSTVMYLQLQ